jgi:hypothetical protein
MNAIRKHLEKYDENKKININLIYKLMKTLKNVSEWILCLFLIGSALFCTIVTILREF